VENYITKEEKGQEEKKKASVDCGKLDSQRGGN
jgi:hypothetical protein